MCRGAMPKPPGYGALLVVAVTACLPAALALASEEAARGHQGDVLYKKLVADLEIFERHERWKESDSSLLGWSCGQDMQALVCLYETTGDRQWLERFFRYAETMFANLTLNRDGFLSWRSRRYSPAYAEALPTAADRSKAAIEPREQWIEDDAVSRKVQDAAFRLVAWRDATLKVEVAEGKEALPAIRYKIGEPFAGPFGIKLTLKTAPLDGDVFTLVTRRPKDFDFAVHDGMVLMPVCRAIELVKRDAALEAPYSERAGKLLRVIETQLLPKWNKYWREKGAGGFLVFPADPAFNPSGSTLPHNQYLPLGTVLVTLYRITGKASYKEQAAKMARFFQSCLRLVDGHYEWNYWDAAGEWDKPWDKPKEKRPEDTGHGSLDIGFVLACADSGIVFTETDLKRFANTLLKVMWNGSLEKPAIGGYVNSNVPTRESGNLQEWLLLSRAEPQVLAVCEPVIRSEGSMWARAQLYLLCAPKQQKAP
ncbi:MAG: hypothetical protein ABSE73_07670 [Planctomycetota bacterium]